MDKFQAIHAFWSSFGLTAYDVNTVPTGENKPELPYITYDAVIGSLGAPVALSGSLWYRGASWGPITTKLLEIEAELGRGGVTLPVDGGAVWFTKGSPFAQRMSDPDDTIRRILINIDAEFFTA